MKFKQVTARAALGLMMALVLPLSAISPLPTESAATVAEAVSTKRVTVAAAASTGSAAVTANRYGVTVDGVPMTTDPMLTVMNGVTYASLRSVASVLTPGANVSWNGASATVYKEGVLSLTATPGLDYISVNGRYLPTAQVIAKNGAVLVSLDTIVKATDAACAKQADGTLSLTRGSGGILPAEQFYNSDDLYWLSRIIYAESGNQPLAGKIAVGNVVLNRVRSPRFPNTIYGVIFQRNQFSPASNGTIKRTPNTESVIAAKLCLDGAVELSNALYFNRVGLKSWASRNRTFVATIAQHSFYA